MAKRNYSNMTNSSDISDMTISSYGDNTTKQDNTPDASDDDDYDDDGYETDATILNEDYDSERERKFNEKEARKKQKMTLIPSTPPPTIYGPEPSTEIRNTFTGSPLYTRFEGIPVPYTRNDSKQGKIPLKRSGMQPKLDELPESIQRNLYELLDGGASKSRRRRRRTKKSSRKRKTNKRRKTRARARSKK
jgi:hypothetical protein